jgi:FkbM family methyltransferase
MSGRLLLKPASLLYKFNFPFYRMLYFFYKRRKDSHHLKLLRKLVKPGDIILDIGANIGFFTSFLSDCAGIKGHVYSFEPDQINFKHLQEGTGEISNVSLIRKAVAATSGVLTLYTSDLLNVDHRTYEPEQYSGKYEVEKISIDDFVSGKFKVDFIKMDIQGFEMEALKGMVKTINANPDLVIFTELWNHGLKRAGSSSAALHDFATQHGFKVYKADSRISEMSLEEAAEMKDDYFTDANIVLTRRDIF